MTKKLYKSIFISLALTISLFVNLGDSARGASVTKFEKFQLWNKCKPINLFVAGLDADSQKNGLTKDAIRTTVLNKLKTARLYNKISTPFLYAQVSVLGGSYLVRLELNKRVFDSASNLSSYAVTWETAIIGIPKKDDPSSILSDVSEKTNEFINEYYRVNEADCDFIIPAPTPPTPKDES